MYSAMQIQQVRATANQKLALESYSDHLRTLYGVRDGCGCNKVPILLLLKFAIDSWDIRPGAVNHFTEAQLNNMVRILNKL